MDRSGGARRRTRRVRGGAVCGLDGAEGRDGGEGEGRRHLPAPRLHPGEGAAARRRGVPHGRAMPPTSGSTSARRARRRTGPRRTSARAASSPHCTRGCRACSSGARSRSSTGFGTLTPDGAVSVDGQTLSGKAVIICAGSVPRAMPGHGDRRRADRHLGPGDQQPASTLPERVAVIGGGVIGAEFASVYTDFGVHTTLLEALPHGVLPIGPDRDTADVLAKALEQARHQDPRRGAGRHARSSPTTVSSFRSRRPKGAEKIEVDQVLVAIGRRPVSEGMGLDAAGVQVSDRGFIEVDTATMLTTRPGVYAIGDCVRHSGARARRLRRGGRRRQIGSRARTRRRSTTAGCRGWSTPIRRWPGRDDRGRGAGSRSRRRRAQALVRGQRPGDDPRGDRRPGEGRRGSATVRSSASTWSGRGPASCCTRATSPSTGRRCPSDVGSADPRASEPVRGNRRNHDHVLRPFVARLRPALEATRNVRRDWVVTMPKLGESVTEGVIGNCSNRSGDRWRSTTRCSRCPPTRSTRRSPAPTTA